jgi:type II secretory ATPase GspE/PulE/Tfp pilus assembly ATPase PilB-like protein
LDIGIVPDVLAGNIIGIIAQRLIRMLCKQCRSPQTPSYSELRLLGLNTGIDSESEITHTTNEKIIYQPVGCEHCDHQGYRGRIAIMELLKIDGDLDDLITRRASARELTKAAQKHGFRTLAEDGVRRVLDGTTSLQEVMRVVDLTERM